MKSLFFNLTIWIVNFMKKHKNIIFNNKKMSKDPKNSEKINTKISEI